MTRNGEQINCKDMTAKTYYEIYGMLHKYISDMPIEIFAEKITDLNFNVIYNKHGLPEISYADFKFNEFIASRKIYKKDSEDK